MIGVIDVGGGMRDVYGSGVFDRCIDDSICFDYILGVSAGTANAFTYAAGQRGRTYRFYHDYSQRKEYMSLDNVLKGRRYLDLDYVYSVLSNEGCEDYFDFDAFQKFPGKAYIACTDAYSGIQLYFDNFAVKRNDLTVFKASSALPMFCKRYSVNGIPCFDGGISVPVPIEKPFEDGCGKVVLVLTIPVDRPKVQGSDLIAAKLLSLKYPALAECMVNRAENYNKAVERALELQKQGKVLVIAPDSLDGMKTLTKDKELIDALYKKGYADAGKIKEFIKG